MELILLQKVRNLGDLGDKVSVKPGYGRNYLIPQGKAVRVNAANLAAFEQEIDRRRKATSALRRVTKGLDIPSTFRVRLHVESRDDLCWRHGQNTSLRLRISAKTSASLAFSMPRWRRIARSCQRRN